MTTRVYFVRHAEPDHQWEEDRSRPLTDEGKQDCRVVQDFFSNLRIDAFYCSPYRRSIDTIAGAAQSLHQEIIIDERLRERKNGSGVNSQDLFQKRWADKDFHEEGGESIHMVQRRIIEALYEILEKHLGQNVVVGTHGTALSSILNYFEPEFDCTSFLRIIDWMPYIIELDFQNGQLVNKTEHLYIQKEFKQQRRSR